MIKVGVLVTSQIYLIETVAYPEAVFLVMFGPSMNEL